MTTQAARPLPDRTAIAPVTSREELIYLLSQACEIEHGLACVYLFAAHSLKSDVAEGGLTEAQSAMLRGWKRKLAGVAVEEMLHLAQVSNMLVAVGGAPHFRRTNFPLPSDAFSFGIPLALEPFTLELAERLVCYEMPEDGVLGVERQPTYDDLRARVIGTIPPKPEAMPTHCSVEPFVNPSGASAETIAQRVRECPSGALGGTLAGRPVLSADAANVIGPVLRDVDLRRGIALEGETFNAGADPDRYALCRCGQSKNKPFCDGSHWYVDFHDETN
ncbi:MAG: hypothetical protein NVS2B8_11270 [Vulcanimicrobiaceae bacterium]